MEAKVSAKESIYEIKSLQEDLRALGQRIILDIQTIGSYVPITAKISHKVYLAKLIRPLSQSLNIIYRLYQHINRPFSVLSENTLKPLHATPKQCDWTTYSKEAQTSYTPINIIDKFSIEVDNLSTLINNLIEKLDHDIHGHFIEHLKFCITFFHKKNETNIPCELNDHKPQYSSEENKKFDSYRVPTPLLPARDNVFNGESINNNVSPVLKSVHSGLICLEVPTIEVCCAILNDFDFSFWQTEFIVDICSQIYDEARHVEILYTCLQKFGIPLGITPAHHRFWNMSHGETLDVRLVIHQKYGEWIGMDAALYRINERKIHSDSYIKNMYESIFIDELHHVTLGNKWSRLFSENYEETLKIALAKRKLLGEDDDGPLKFDLNHEVCAISGFTADEIYSFSERQRRNGVLNSIESLTTVIRE